MAAFHFDHPQAGEFHQFGYFAERVFSGTTRVRYSSYPVMKRRGNVSTHCSANPVHDVRDIGIRKVKAPLRCQDPLDFLK